MNKNIPIALTVAAIGYATAVAISPIGTPTKPIDIAKVSKSNKVSVASGQYVAADRIVIIQNGNKYEILATDIVEQKKYLVSSGVDEKNARATAISDAISALVKLDDENFTDTKYTIDFDWTSNSFIGLILDNSSK